MATQQQIDEQNQAAIDAGLPVPPRTNATTITSRPPGINPGDTPDEQPDTAILPGTTPFKRASTGRIVSDTATTTRPPITGAKKSAGAKPITIKGAVPFQPDKRPLKLQTKGLSKHGAAIINRVNQESQKSQTIIHGTDKFTISGRGTFDEKQASREMARIGKGMVPFWLTVEDWKHMSPLERGASLAGDIGSVILLGLSTGIGRGPKTTSVKIPKAAQFEPVDIHKLPFEPHGMKGPSAPSYGYAYEYRVPVVDPSPRGMPPRLPKAVPTGKVIVVPGPTIEVPSGGLLSRSSRIAVKTITKTPTKKTIPIKKIVDQAAKINDDLLTKPTRRTAPANKGLSAKEIADMKAAARRMTPEQFNRYYGASEIIIAIGMPTDFISVKIKPTGKTEPKTATEINTGTDDYNRTRTILINREKQQQKSGARTSDKTSTSTRTRASTGTRQQTKTKTAPKTQQAARTVTETATRTKATKTPAKTPPARVTTPKQLRQPNTKPPSKIPPIPRGKKKTTDFEELTLSQKRGGIAWKQGLGWWVILPDGRTFFTLKKPTGVEIREPSNRPGRTLTAVGGRPRAVTTADLGNKDIRVTFARGGNPGKIEFFNDPGNRTRQQIQLGQRGNNVKSVKRGKVFVTRIKGGKLLSRRRLG